MFDVSGIAADKDEEFRPFAQARPSIVVPGARRKRVAHKPRADPRVSEMDLAGDDPASDGGNIYPIDHPLDHQELQTHAFPTLYRRAWGKRDESRSCSS